MKSKTQATSSRIKLTNENYYDRETDKQYQSVTLFKSYLECEARTQATVDGAWQPPESEALLAGNFLHSYFESPEAHQKFIETAGKSMVSGRGKTKGQLKSTYTVIQSAIDTLESDKGFKQLYKGDKEVIVTGKLFGVWWKGKIDCLDLEHGRFYDLKTTQKMNKAYWNEEERQKESFVAHYKYYLQMWVYQQLINQTFGAVCDPYIIAVDKQKVPDKTIISINDDRMNEAEEIIAQNQEHIEMVRNKEIEPSRCNSSDCDYCKSTKKLSEITDMDNII